MPACPDQRSLFAKISTPVLVVAGEEDGVAHLAGLENPPLVNNLIDEFVFRE